MCDGGGCGEGVGETALGSFIRRVHSARERTYKTSPEMRPKDGSAISF